MWDELDRGPFAYAPHIDSNLNWDITPDKRWNAPKTQKELTALADVHRQSKELYDTKDMLNLLALSSRLVFDENEIYPDKPDPKTEWLYKAAPLIQKSDEDIFPSVMRFLRLVEKEGKQNVQKMLSNPDKVEEALEEMKKQESPKKVPGGKKGGTGEDYEKGVWSMYESYMADKTFPSIGMTDVMTRTKATKSDKFVFGIPKDKVLRTYMRKPSELQFLTEAALCMDDDEFYLNFADNRLPIELPMKEIKNKTKLFVLLDRSGSMSSTTKMCNTVHILNTMFDEVIAGNAEIYFSYFVWRRDKFIKIDSEETVEHFKTYTFSNPGGGTTTLGDILPTLAAEIQSGKVDGFEVTPTTEVVIINDGEDDVPPIHSIVPIHSFMLEETNTELVQLARSSKGQAFYVNHNGDFQLL